ncbi:hypothetical protein LIER_35630 [Lithospermum erythrorhizon]|uniref:Uncharacterized protein n=1 Tax=Lithospermum erythrorhizon TaxID=34254 RepID=A0AAV3NTP8_LITER
MQQPRTTERVIVPPPRMRSFFVVVLENGLRLPVHPFVGGVLSLVRTLEALMATYNCALFGRLRPPGNAGLVVVSSSSEEDEDHTEGPPAVEPSGISSGSRSAMKDHREVGTTTPLASNSSNPQAPPAQAAQATVPSPPPFMKPSASKKREGSPVLNQRILRGNRTRPLLYSPSLALGPRVSEKCPANMGYEELISSLSSIGNKLFDLHGVALQAYGKLLSFYEEASRSTSSLSQIKQEMKTFRKHQAREDGILQCRLQNLTRDYDSLKERYAANVRKMDFVMAELEGLQVERDSTLLEREAFRKKREILRTSKEEACNPTTTCWAY